MVTTSNENKILVNQLSKQVAYFNEQDIINNRGGINLLFIENRNRINQNDRINNENILFEEYLFYNNNNRTISSTEKIIKFLSKLRNSSNKKDKLKVHCITLYW